MLSYNVFDKLPDEILSRVKLNELNLWTAQKLYPENKLSVLKWDSSQEKNRRTRAGQYHLRASHRFPRARGPLSQSYDFQMRALRVMQRYPSTTVFCKLFVHRSKLIVSENLNSSREAKIVLNDYSIHLRDFLLFTIFKSFCYFNFPCHPPWICGLQFVKKDT